MTPLTRSKIGACLILLAVPALPVSGGTLYPVISKVEILFSMVSHHCHLTDRVSFYNSYGSPKGNLYYAVPHLVYEPSVTLYNPYNEPLTMTRSRVKIWDPPVGFTFKKNDDFLRDAFAAGEFHGLARLQIANENNVNARKTFTLSLSSPTESGQPGAPIVLQPGESKTFSAWVESNWNWGVETAGGYTPRAFFDWNFSNDFTNRDGRTLSAFGAEAVSSNFTHYLHDPRAGFQTDALSLAAARPAATRYSFETSSGWAGNWVAIKVDEVVRVQAKAMRAFPASATPDFQVALLKGLSPTIASDTVKGFPLSVSGIIQNEAAPVISRAFRVEGILQHPIDMTPGGKTPFAALTMVAKASALRGNLFYATPVVPAAELYELHFVERTHFYEDPPMPSDAPTGGLEVLGVERVGDKLYVDYTATANSIGLAYGAVRGTSSLEDGFTDDLSAVTTKMASQSAAGIYKAIIDISGRGDRYFVQIEY
ncbi:hypothetical protein [Luteolibacter marinus]|uniref:hypothetical protein n=1 Tax=Luteolibacter marinus TaxID=2776705 RepID=UPI0018694C41|nr:hypothetical protein [Luteolibacter marinus]